MVDQASNKWQHSDFTFLSFLTNMYQNATSKTIFETTSAGFVAEGRGVEKRPVLVRFYRIQPNSSEEDEESKKGGLHGGTPGVRNNF